MTDEVSPLVAKINKMIKVIRQNLPEYEYKENDKNSIPLVKEDPNSLRNIILAISFFDDLDMNDGRFLTFYLLLFLHNVK